MLVISRKVGERLSIGEDIEVTVCRIESDKVRLGIEAPKEVSIVRSEAKDREPKKKP